ncbi:type II 3-dehydroquinate dehydratase [Psychroflexus planctonicus]|uniref:3-dehydroquinate dehydratase n=1 Tax=Psychroflexus planctonicus TaxID=1526575 RepID=A0ABQ1SIT6_9FLAO|nr:type II 3-dehydroquinate dehydratase [Psychroflexus planctonicus]GGE38965.1 3-dehydroquinate dehydratase [Psychroflexus planctonicus]
MKIHIINGPNLNMLGIREPEIYGKTSFKDFFSELQFQFKDIELSYFQSNIEGELISEIHEANDNVDGIVLNAAAYTHTSIALADAIKILDIPVVEVHISNVYARENFRKHSYIAPHALGVISGFGLQSYALAIQSFI